MPHFTTLEVEISYHHRVQHEPRVFELQHLGWRGTRIDHVQIDNINVFRHIVPLRRLKIIDGGFVQGSEFPIRVAARNFRKLLVVNTNQPFFVNFVTNGIRVFGC